MAGVDRPVSRGQTRQPSAPAGRPFQGSHLNVGPQHPMADVNHGAGSVKPSSAKGTGVPGVGSVPSKPKKGTFENITPKRGRGR